MCGIVGYVGSRDCVPILLEGLARLEYRGYDSAGVAVVGRGKLRVRKVKGRVGQLAQDVPARLSGPVGIGHTRWATHGVPSEQNAHPHVDGSGRVAVVHNGVIENAEELRAKLTADGVVFASETDTEVLAHLIAAVEVDDIEEAVRRVLPDIVGTYGIAVVDTRQPDRIVAARNGSPVILGVGDKELFVASDVMALVRHTSQVVHLEDGEVAVLTADGFSTRTLDATVTTRPPTTVDVEDDDYQAEGYGHFMRKEIHDQPTAVERTLRGRLDDRFGTAHLGGLNLTPRESREFKRVKILGCGSAHYAGQIGAQLIEELARVPADSEPASEFRYRNPLIDPDTLYVAVSQSGETYDTLATVQEIQRKGGRVLGVVNAVGSSIARQCDGGIYLHAGPEISVTSTKAFTVTTVDFALLALHLARVRDLSPADGQRLVRGLRALPAQIGEILKLEDQIAGLAREYGTCPNVMFIGRVRGWPVAREGALKLKEVSYVHAEAYPASELKHGPLALISPETPTVAIVPDDELYDKNLTTLGEIKARGGRILALAHRELPTALADHTIVVPRAEPELDPILLGIPLQMLAYHAAVLLGHDVDHPRNLAKSVTVE
ncbi:glutamine--fructose-6-phosphate transaminase (isomerizing) [Kutzneria kofuensis]|uniref:Glutamine--fructose-6-phosphate aminotransferase [isomerizing] n=1 Tax=Kutzneria kofuensis TaxID=103725 RepID=A0A7W9KID1_9PSEU|nr:glutamine--fructose-6-phosphate transaminase (isomerizing) [Kutzneria kofuensis]MBB5893007.1 glucosamine--fructose-6-phosphate aminotransferase (isomerizing) [Kutzneria kofuensis]